MDFIVKVGGGGGGLLEDLFIPCGQFFKPHEDEEDEKKNGKNKENVMESGEFMRVLRMLTMLIDEKTKDKSLFDYIKENLILTEVIQLQL